MYRFCPASVTFAGHFRISNVQVLTTLKILRQWEIYTDKKWKWNP
jgi:hypothetical protein